MLPSEPHAVGPPFTPRSPCRLCCDWISRVNALGSERIVPVKLGPGDGVAIESLVCASPRVRSLLRCHDK